MFDNCPYQNLFKKKKALITGGAGFIGSHLTQHLSQLGCSVHVLDNFSTGKRINLDGVKAKIIEGSILDQDTVYLFFFPVYLETF